MKNRQGDTLSSLRASRDFLDAHKAEAPVTAASGARKKLDAAITDLAVHMTDQSGGTVTAKLGTKNVKALRVALLRQNMAPISRIAKVTFSGVQELTPLKTPRGTPSNERLVAAARGMAQAAAPHADVFISDGLPADFIARLNTAADALLVAKDARTRVKGKTSGATKGLITRLKEARQVISVLDGLLSVELAGQPVLLKDWKTIKRLPRARSSSAAAAGIAPPSTVVGSITPAPATVASTPPATPPAATTTPATPTAPATPATTASAAHAA